MAHLGNLEGTATLLVRGKPAGTVRYFLRIEGREVGGKIGSKSGQGSIDGAQDAISAAFDALEATLQTEAGDLIRITVVGAGGSIAAIKLNGPAPGF